ncbi:MAG: carboxypeptidase-like regulatory domain-containing protein [Pseudomonas sp.]
MIVTFSGCVSSLGTPAFAQRITIDGVVVEAGTRVAVVGATVTLHERVRTLTDRNGAFRISNIEPGRVVLSVSAVGYATTEISVVAHADTALRIELAVSPVVIDPLQVQTGFVTVRGVVREKTSNAWLIDVDVLASTGTQTRTNIIGEFKIPRAPIGVPLDIRLENFGYLSIIHTIVPQRDTTLTFALAHDSAMMAIVAALMRRLDERSAGRRYKFLPTLERAQLLEDLNRSGTIADILRYRLGQAMYRRVACVVVDENPIRGRQFVTMLPDRIQRVEILEIPGMSRRLMVRIYTRAFVQDLLGKVAALAHRDQVLSMNVGRGFCQ